MDETAAVLYAVFRYYFLGQAFDDLWDTSDPFTFDFFIKKLYLPQQGIIQKRMNHPKMKKF